MPPRTTISIRNATSSIARPTANDARPLWPSGSASLPEAWRPKGAKRPAETSSHQTDTSATQSPNSSLDKRAPAVTGGWGWVCAPKPSMAPACLPCFGGVWAGFQARVSGGPRGTTVWRFSLPAGNLQGTFTADAHLRGFGGSKTPAFPPFSPQIPCRARQGKLAPGREVSSTSCGRPVLRIA